MPDNMTTPRLSCTAVKPVRAVPGLMQDVQAGLLQPPRSLPPKYFYDEIGSRIFEQICQTREYYPSRMEAALLQANAAEIIQICEPAHLIELGSGSARKTRFLFDACAQSGHRCVYWPFDVAEEMLMGSATELVEEYPWLNVRALHGDYNGGLALPLPEKGRRLIAFLGGTIGNFEPAAARALLSEVRDLLRPGDNLLLGLDRVKDTAVLQAAYDDAEGHTARFNLNVLHVLNRELDANFPVADYRHRALFNSSDSRIEMRLRASTDHSVCLRHLDTEIQIQAGEEILTEVSRKFTHESLSALLGSAGLCLQRHMQAPGGAYSLVIAGVGAGGERA